MGHAIDYVEFKAGTSEKVIRQEAADFTAMNCDRYENPYGDYTNRFSKINRVAKNRDEACDALDALGTYHDGYIEFYSDPEPTKKMTHIKDQIRSKAHALDKFICEHSVKNRTSAFISCPHCKSKISREHWNGGTEMRKNERFMYMPADAKHISSAEHRFTTLSSGAAENCPICGHDIRPQSTIDAINKRIEAINDLVKKYDEEKAKRKGVKKILAKFETHC